MGCGIRMLQGNRMVTKLGFSKTPGLKHEKFGWDDNNRRFGSIIRMPRARPNSLTWAKLWPQNPCDKRSKFLLSSAGVGGRSTNALDSGTSLTPHLSCASLSRSFLSSGSLVNYYVPHEPIDPSTAPPFPNHTSRTLFVSSRRVVFLFSPTFSHKFSQSVLFGMTLERFILTALYYNGRIRIMWYVQTSQVSYEWRT